LNEFHNYQEARGHDRQVLYDMTYPIEISGRKIGKEYEPFIIAEISGNHNQSIERALAIAEAAAKSGAHALKIQTHTPDTMTLDLNKEYFFRSVGCVPRTYQYLPVL